MSENIGAPDQNAMRFLNQPENNHFNVGVALGPIKQFIPSAGHLSQDLMSLNFLGQEKKP
ncbi:MAG: hypothetical protein OXD29_08710 [Roseovarius sp.]|nr:hypothetical protein [Roseovarius sp.]